jgi:hypothetical protein
MVRFPHVVHVLATLVIAATSFGCGIGDKVDLLIDQADNEIAKECTCSWQVGGYDSEESCFEDRKTSESERGCIEGAFDESEDRDANERALDCLNEAYSALDMCNRDLACSNNLSKLACNLTFLGDVDRCPDAGSDLNDDLGKCINLDP